MRVWSPANARNPVWRLMGGMLLAGTLAMTLLYIQRGPKPVKPRETINVFSKPGGFGEFGTFTEQLGQGRFILAYRTVTGTEKDLSLQGVRGRLEEPETLWTMDSPSAQRKEGIWVLDGPMRVEAISPIHKELLGRGHIPGSIPALQWDHGVWRGLSTLIWEDLGQGRGRGTWTLPPGWRRGLDHRIVVDQGPARWVAADASSSLRQMIAKSLWVTLGFQDGWMADVDLELEDGRIHTREAIIDPEKIRMLGPIVFQRDDGWRGEAKGGQAPRPTKGEAVECIELAELKAKRALKEGPETLQALGARWTPAGFRLEGDIRWEQPMNGERLGLRAPRVLMREAPGGTDLPPTLPTGETWAEGQAVLSWGKRTLSSPKMEARSTQKSWRILAPIQGRSEEGTFSAGAGTGNPAKWIFEGPVQAQFFDGSAVRGQQLIWEADAWIFMGRPVSWQRVRERLSGTRIIRRPGSIEFPEGINGSLAAQDGDLLLRADKGLMQGDRIRLEGRVECHGQGWRLQAERISVTLGPGNVVKMVEASGRVTLRGRLGEGQGEALDLNLASKTTRWRGRVHGLAEIQP